MSSYTEWFVRFQGNPAVMEEVKAIQERKRVQGYDPNLTTVVKGPSLPQSFRDLGSSHIPNTGVEAADLADLFSPDNDGLGMGADGLFCSFCKAPLQTIDATSEKRPKIRISTEAKKDPHTGEIHIEEKVKTVAQEYHACPKCSLQIQKPIIVSRV